MPDFCQQGREGSTTRRCSRDHRTSLYQRSTGQKQLSGKGNIDFGKHTENIDEGYETKEKGSESVILSVGERVDSAKNVSIGRGKCSR